MSERQATCDRCGAMRNIAELDNRDTFLFCRNEDACNLSLVKMDTDQWRTALAKAREEKIRNLESELFEAGERVKFLENRIADIHAAVNPETTCETHGMAWRKTIREQAEAELRTDKYLTVGRSWNLITALNEAENRITELVTKHPLTVSDSGEPSDEIQHHDAEGEEGEDARRDTL